MTLVAWLVFLLVTAYTIWDGVRRTIGSKTMEGFFAAGRNIPWWAAGLSVMATQLSAITLIGGVGMGYEGGLEWVQFYFALPFAMVILCIWFVPMYRRHPILTAYEYLERRFGPVTRTLTSFTFLISRCLAFAVVLYAPALVFSTMTGIPITPMVIVVGIVTTGYTVAGGVGGVVWTDVKQMVLIVIGIVACLGFLLWDTVGELSLGGVFTALGAAGKLNAVEISNPAWTLAPALTEAAAATSFWSDKYNLWTGLFGTLFLFLSYFGCDQVQVQSLLSSKSVDASRRALLMSAFTKVPLQLLVLVLGGLLFLHHGLGREPLLFDPAQQRNAQQLDGEAKARFDQAAAAHTAASERRQQSLRRVAAGDDSAVAEFQQATIAATEARKQARVEAQPRSDRRADGNYIFTDYLFRELPKPLLGLMIAAIFAAAISSAAGALSSLTSASMVDFYRRWLRPHADDRQAVRTSRIVMSFWGLAATGFAITLGDGPLLEKVNEIGSWFYGSILGVFLLALFHRRASGTAASAGLIGGLLSVAVVHNTMHIAFLWYNLVGALGCVLVGSLVATVAPQRPAPAVDAP
ncbi:MAG: sodium:solute symporter [Planctomycetes bacterium]|jgi:Na+/proline symporter|nr:sodium:solute symporter [Planctomycetota bacterium]